MPTNTTDSPRIVFLGAGFISGFATSYRCLALARCLVEDYDAEVHFVVAANDDDPRTYGHEHHSVRLHYANDLPILLTRWRYDPQLLLRTLARTWRRFWRAWRLKPDVVHVFKPLPETLLAGALLKLLGYKVVLDEDDADADMMAAAGPARDAWRWRLTRRLSSVGHRLCHAVTVASRALQVVYERRGVGATYLPNGIFPEDFVGRVEATKPEGEVVALYLGALEPHFDADMAIEAFATAHEQCPALRLIVVGDGSMRDALEGRAGELGCDDVVEFAGRVPKGEVIDWLNRAHVFLFPMRDNWINRCRCPLKLREFAAMGRPLVAPAFGEALEVVAAKNDLVPADADSDAYAAKLAEIAQALLDGSRAPSPLPPLDAFDWHDVTPRLVEVYSALLPEERLLCGNRKSAIENRKC